MLSALSTHFLSMIPKLSNVLKNVEACSLEASSFFEGRALFKLDGSSQT